MKKIVSILFLLGGLLVGVGCGSKSQLNIVLDSTPTSTIPATATVAITSSPTGFSVTTIQTAEPTATLYPFDKLWQSDFCDLPCWLGMMPGSSTWYDIERSLSVLNYRVRPLDITSTENVYGAVLEHGAVRHYIEIYTEQDVVQSVHIRVEDTEYQPGNFNWSDPDERWRQFEPGPLIRRYGKPDRTLIATDYEFANRGSSWLLGGLFLIFEKQKFIVKYDFHMSLYTQQFCPTFSHPINMENDVEYYDPTSLIPNFDIYTTAGKLKSDLYELLPVQSFTSAGFTLFEERTGITDWVTLLLENPGHCFIIPPPTPTP
jgi:hypothetical protein